MKLAYAHSTGGGGEGNFFGDGCNIYDDDESFPSRWMEGSGWSRSPQTWDPKVPKRMQLLRHDLSMLLSMRTARSRGGACTCTRCGGTGGVWL